jgi:hypothetical protein
MSHPENADFPDGQPPAAGRKARPFSPAVLVLLRTFLLKKSLGCLEGLDGCVAALPGQEADCADELYRTLQVKIRELAALIRQLLDKP